MSKKLFIPLLAIAAFAVPVTAAQAIPLWHTGGTGSPPLGKGKVVTTIGWGTLTLESPVGTITCFNSSVGTIENPSAGTNGIDATETFAPIKCVSACPEPIGVTPEGLPWLSELETTGPPSVSGVRDSFKGIKVRITCPIAGINVVFEGENHPEAVNGTNPSKPSFSEFDANSGELTSVVGPGKTSGKAKVIGYEKQETVQTGNP